MKGHEHEWGEWFYPVQHNEEGDVTRSRWCACGAYEMWTRTSRDLDYHGEGQQ